jgi:hypothetical protein
MREGKSKNKLKILEYFFLAKNNSIKHYKYFEVYKNLFSKYVDKKIVFVEIGILNGGSLQLWKKFLGKKAKIIVIDINPYCKKLEEKRIQIFIGDQTNEIFWQDFFKKVGEVDIILDDGGHTNYQQIKTTTSCIPNIKDEGLLLIEDTWHSYISKKYYNPSKYSFINFCKKLINDNNYRYPNIGKYKFSLNKYIFSIEFFESIVCFNINKKLCLENIVLKNSGINIDVQDMTHKISNSYSLNNKTFLGRLKSKIKFFKGNFVYLIFLVNQLKLKRFFK